PPLCMLLRKKLSGGRIISIKSPGIERICEIEVESQNEMGDVISIGDNEFSYFCFPQENVSVTKARLATEEIFKIKKQIRDV
ncbi:MAG: NFACT family protein, partial [Clostridia bacterium]|nr:NFACT family protein [Clostridia bacterium]